MATNALGAVTVVNSTSGTYNSTTATPSGTFTIPYTVQSADNVLVFGTYYDAAGAISSLQYNGVAATSVLNPSRTALAYFLNPAAGTFNLTATVPANINNGYYILELSGFDKTAPVAFTTATTATDRNDANGVPGSAATAIPTTVAGSFIVDAVGINNQSPTTASLAPDADSVLTVFGSQNANGELGGGFVTIGTATAGGPGTYQLGWSATNTFGYGEAAFAFAPAVPEPATVALAGTVGLFALLRRRNTAR